MTETNLVAVVLLFLVAAYTCGGGADFGAGMWDLLAGGAAGARPRELVDYAMGPVWEANNVWLVFVLVVTWTGFPAVFEAVMSTTWIALVCAALGIVLRGAAFATRKPAQGLSRRRLGIVFGVASTLTPFFLAAALGGIASGRVPPGNRAGDPITSWLNPTSMVFGAVGLTAALFVAAAFLVSDARRFRAPDLETYFRRRSLASGALLLVVMAAGLVVVREDAPRLYDGLTSGAGLALAIVAVASILATLLLMSRRGLRGSRLSAMASLTALVFAWGLAQRPYALPTTLTIQRAAGDPHTLRWLLVVTIVAVACVGPALALLYRLDLTDRLAADHDEDLAHLPESPDWVRHGSRIP